MSSGYECSFSHVKEYSKIYWEKFFILQRGCLSAVVMNACK